MTQITLEDLKARCDFDRSEQAVRAAVGSALADGESLLRFLGRYISWNGFFGSGVAELASKIGRNRGLFVDPTEPIAVCADRSVHVASFFFDAARDEFDDSATPHRDTHRSLAQATVKGLVTYFGLEPRANELLVDPPWLAGLNQRVHTGYGGGSEETLQAVFRAMGYHLGSEILADEEFTVIDRSLREQRPQLVDALLKHRVTVADEEHPAYYWIGIHSGHGGGVEAEHFEWALGGVTEGFRYVDPDLRPSLREETLLGFEDFAACHTEFFDRVGS